MPLIAFQRIRAWKGNFYLDGKSFIDVPAVYATSAYVDARFFSKTIPIAAMSYCVHFLCTFLEQFRRLAELPLVIREK